MKTLIINTENQSDLKLLMNLVKRLGFDSRILTDEEKEDMGLLKAMLEGKKSKIVSRSIIMKQLIPKC